MADIFVFGHGGWAPNDGYTQVPPKTSVRFFTEGNRLMSVDFAVRLMSGNAPGAQPDMEASAYRSVQNLRLYPAPEFHGEVQHAIALAGGGVQVRIVQDPNGVTLARLLAELKGNNITWIACRALGLHKVKTRVGRVEQRIPGINQIQR